MPGEASKDFPQVSSDPDVNRTMNLVWVLNLIADMKMGMSVIAEKSVVFYHV